MLYEYSIRLRSLKCHARAIKTINLACNASNLRRKTSVTIILKSNMKLNKGNGKYTFA